MSNEFFHGMAQFAITVQSLVERGWKFSYEEGERKFELGNFTAVKGGKVEKTYESGCIESFLDGLLSTELEQEWKNQRCV